MAATKTIVAINCWFNALTEKILRKKTEKEIFNVTVSFEYPRFAPMHIKKVEACHQLWFGGIHFCNISQDHQRLLITCVDDDGPRIFINGDDIFEGLSKYVSGVRRFSIEHDIRYRILREWYLLVN